MGFSITDTILMVGFSITDTILMVALLGIWGFAVLSYSIRFKKIAWVLFVMATFPLMMSSAVFLVLSIWPWAWWLNAMIKSARTPKLKPETNKKKVTFRAYLQSTTTLIFVVLTALSIPADGRYGWILAALTFLALSVLLSLNHRTIIEDISGITVTDKNGARLNFFQSIVRYFLMIATFPLGFGAINFMLSEPIYNMVTGAVEHENENVKIKNGWIFRLANQAAEEEPVSVARIIVYALVLVLATIFVIYNEVSPFWVLFKNESIEISSSTLKTPDDAIGLAVFGLFVVSFIAPIYVWLELFFDLLNRKWRNEAKLLWLLLFVGLPFIGPIIYLMKVKAKTAGGHPNRFQGANCG